MLFHLGSYLPAGGPRSAAAPRGASRAAAVQMAGTCLITDGTDSFFGSRTIFQALHDFGDFEKQIAFSSSVADAKKMCISRQARYSGLIDVLDFVEGGDAELASALGDAAAWVVMNGDAATLPAQYRFLPALQHAKGAP